MPFAFTPLPALSEGIMPGGAVLFMAVKVKASPKDRGAQRQKDPGTIMMLWGTVSVPDCLPSIIL